MLMAVVFFGCAQERMEVGPTPLYDVQGRFFERPWPSDTRTQGGFPDMEGYPNPIATDLLQQYIDTAETVRGFGTNSPIYLPFDGPIDSELMPDVTKSLSLQSPVLLIDIDQNSPYWGEPVPFTWQQTPVATRYEPANLLSIMPQYGFPLRPNNRYAVVVTRDIARQAEALEDWPNSELFDADLDHLLPFVGLEDADLAMITTFTTQAPLTEMARVALHARTQVAPALLEGATLQPLANRDRYDVYETTYRAPLYTHGIRPYDTEGGDFRFAEDGTPIVAEYETMRLAICTPKDLSNPPPQGWPVVIYQHGTGGDYLTPCDSNSSLEVGAQLADEGIITLAIDQPLHGTRVGPTIAGDLSHFNFLNPASGRTNFRQGALDALYLAHSLARSPLSFRTVEGVDVPVDNTNVMFMGHSQGGLTGAIAAPFFNGDVRAAVISGAGGILAITLDERKDIVDLEMLLETLLGFYEDEDFSPYHPVAALIQTIVEPTDPINSGPYWFAERSEYSGQIPTAVLHLSGTLDAATPYTTGLALGAAAKVPLLNSPATATVAHDLKGIPPIDTPTTMNTLDFNHHAITAGMTQIRDGSHFILFEEPMVSERAVHFLKTSSQGEGWLQ